MTIPTGFRISHYEIVGPLGAGGMGEVYRARDTRLEREVAVKTLPAPLSSDPDRLRRFIREAKVLASLNHPNIGAIYGLEELPSGERFLILELIQGETLAERLNRGALAVPEALRVCGAITEAFEAAHERGVIHRDLKPGNVMLASNGIVKILDFGLARQVSLPAGAEAVGFGTVSLRTEAGRAVGTPGYMSPEQLRGEEQDRRTDIFAFGCVLYECLTGSRAFSGTSAFDRMVAVLREEPSWAALPSDAPPEIRRLLAHCLEKDPERRLRDIGNARIALEGACGTRRAVAGAVGEVPHNLPQELTSFVGRERELSECADLFGETRLITLSGVGGCGKTRLALRLAESRLAAHPDGVWFVDLATVSDPERVPQAVAASLGVREELGKPILESLGHHLAPKRTLVVLDNCEHLLMACATLSERLLTSAPELRLIATSREGLGVKGERPYAVRSLSVPAPDRERDLHAVEASEAVRLFVDRARAVTPDFRLGQKTAAAVCEICRRLDGIPLAIELAASRMKMLSVDQIRARLDDRFRLLTGGSKTALPRHQTLRATIQWSYDQLSREEQRLFRVLAVFAGGWTLDAVTAIAGGGEDEFGMLDLLTILADKSLVVVEREANGEPRYRMLETVRQYAQERLNEAGEGDGARTRHLDFYLTLAEEAEPNLEGAEQVTWLNKLDREHENLLAALAWCEQAEDGAEKGLRLAAAAGGLWHARSYFRLGRGMLAEALKRPEGARHTLVRARALHRAGQLAVWQGDYASARPLLEEGLGVARGLVDKRWIGELLNQLGNMTNSQGDVRAARSYYEEGLASWREAGWKQGMARILNNLGTLEIDIEALYDDARSHFEEALALQRELGNRHGIGIALLNLADVKITADGREQLAESLTLLREVGDKDASAAALGGCAQLALALGEAERAACLYGASEALQESIGSGRSVANQELWDANLGRIRSELGEDRFAQRSAEGRALSFEAAVKSALEWLEGRDATDAAEPV